MVVEERRSAGHRGVQVAKGSGVMGRRGAGGRGVVREVWWGRGHEVCGGAAFGVGGCALKLGV